MKFIDKLGPGLLYAAAAIGVSHLVQSTRAGALYGSALIGMVILANLIKLPTFQIAAKYTSSTGKTLLDGYKELGNSAVIAFIVLTFATMFTVQSAVTIVTAGIASSILDIAVDPKIIALILLAICSFILLWGHYHVLDKSVKYIVLILTVTTLTCLVFAVSANFPNTAPENVFDYSNSAHIFFLVALMGWMPAPLDLSVTHSLWLKTKMRSEPMSYKQSMTDFKIGYFGTMMLAVVFLTLGWLVMYRSGIELSPKSHTFATQLIGLYTKTLGGWAYPIIAMAAFVTMFSTTLTCLDAFPRGLREAIQLLRGDETNHAKTYNFWVLTSAIVSAIILLFFMENMKAMVDTATTLSFVIAPCFAFLNMRVMNNKDVPDFAKPSKAFNFYGYLCAVLLTVFAGYFIYIRFI